MDYHLDCSCILDAGAWFLPSVQPFFVQTLSKDLYDLRGEHRPKTLYSTSQLNFLDPVHGFYFYPCALYSAGLAELDLARGRRSETMIHNRDRSKTTLFADSGGFQLIEGKLPIDWDDPDKTLLAILRWMEATCDVGMTLDVPLRAIDSNPRFPTFKACLDQTLYNLDFFQRHQAGTLDLINCLHGRNEQEADAWFDAVKMFRFAGWAFGGVLGNNLYLALRQLVRIRDEGRLQGAKYLHFFGHATGNAALTFSMIQSVLRQSANTTIQVTYDASTPFLKSRYKTVDLYYTHIWEGAPFRLTMEQFDDSLKHNNPDKPYPDAWSPVMRNVVVGDILSPKRNKNGHLDSLSHAIIQSHNTFVQIKAIEDAHYVMGMEINARQQGSAPTALVNEAIGIAQIIDDVFASEMPLTVLQRYKEPLEAFLS